MNRRIIVSLIAVAIVVVVAVAWYFVSANRDQQSAENYLDTKQQAIEDLESLKISAVLQDAIDQAGEDNQLSRSEIDQVQKTCDQAERIHQSLPEQVAQGEEETVRASEDKYALEQLRLDAQNYFGLCEYYIADLDYGQQVTAARQSDEYKSFQLENCAGAESCYDPVQLTEYAKYYEASIISPLRQKAEFYRQADCPVSVDGGERFCDAMSSYFAAELDYSQRYFTELEKNSVEADDPAIDAAYERWLRSYESLERASRGVGSGFASPNDVMVGQAESIEAKFGRALSD